MRATAHEQYFWHGHRIAGLSLLVSVVLLISKLIAYQLTGSAAVLSDALESIVNVCASAFALFSVTLSARPPDDSHPYGHGKVEFLSAGFEGALIVAAALVIFWTAIPRLTAAPATGTLVSRPAVALRRRACQCSDGRVFTTCGTTHAVHGPGG